MERATSHYAELLEQRFSNGMLAELQAYPNFVTWTLTQDDKKIPINPTTGRAASTTDPNTWTPLDEALDALKKGKGRGIGFVFSKEDPFTGIDIDHCVLNTKIIPEAREVVTNVWSYTERSPSQEGLHIIVKGTIPEGRRKDGIEIYSSGRYFTLTTNHLRGTPDTIEERQSQLITLYASLTPKETSREAFKPKDQQLYVSDRTLLEKAQNARNGAYFTTLYRGSVAGFGSKSEADFTLVLLLLYWSNDDTEQVKRLFRQSGLYDEKTDRQTAGSTYLDVTIANALKKRGKR